MSLFRAMWKTILSNSYVVLGVLVGILISNSFNNFDCYNRNIFQQVHEDNDLNPVSIQVNRLNLEKSPITPKKLTDGKKPEKRITRPRYYSTELGIREKLFVGILTTEQRLNNQSVYINRTIGHLLDQIKYFISVHNKPKVEYSLTNIVGFTDTRPKYKPFQVIKYLFDNYIQEYDYFFIANDYNYINARQLKDLVNKISVSQDVYMGTTSKDSSFCDLNAGILFSNSVITAVKNNLESCIKNSISDDHSENLGRCVHYSTGLECQEQIQSQTLRSYKLRHFGLKKHFSKISQTQKFNTALSIYPVLEEHEFYLLHSYFSRLRLEKLNKDIQKLSGDLTDSWPEGEKPPVKPATRFDLPQQLYFNTTHLFSPDDFTNIRPHTETDFADIQKIISATLDNFLQGNSSKYIFQNLVNGYRTFDWSRGLDYVIDLSFNNVITGLEEIKRFEISKPLSKVEFTSVPYVTENTRVIILLPIHDTEIGLCRNFLSYFQTTFMENKEKVLLVLAFLYDPNQSNEDIFKSLKEEALTLSNKYHSEDSKIVWVSIKLPKSDVELNINKLKVLNFAVIDLALRKIGTDSLVLVMDVYSEPRTSFINKVRMNTILNFQIFNPIPFRQYDPKVSGIENLEINKNAGHFDREEYKYISFYGKDYVNMRLKSQVEIPIVKTDKDIEKLLVIDVGFDQNVFNMFVKYSKDLHAMRAVETGLFVKNHLEINKMNLFIGSKVQLAKLILNNQEKLGISL